MCNFPVVLIRAMNHDDMTVVVDLFSLYDVVLIFTEELRACVR